ncbi:MAG: hypothetical protein M3P04_14315 [Actinomycetota bacterium]|nr:hypothetical protein [Actinomycetota bacterium]
MRRLLPIAVLGTLALTVLGLPSGTPTAAHAPRPSLQQLLDDAGQDGVPFDPLLASVSCPVERGPVKGGFDADRYKVSTTVTNTSIYALRTRTKPASYPRNNRIAPYELHTYSVNAILKQYKQESDGDIHLVIKDSAGRTMIAELAYPSCASSSRWRTSITSVRSAFTHTYSVSTSWHYVNRSLTIRGLAMFDQLHGQTGVAPNGMELHPVTAIAFH